MKTEEYSMTITAFESEEDYKNYINISNKIDAFCTQAKILDTVAKTNKYVEATMEFCDANGAIQKTVKVFSPVLNDANGEREIFAAVGSKVVRLGVETAFEAGGVKLGQSIGGVIVAVGGATPPAWIMGTATGGAFYLGGKFIGIGVGHYAEKASYNEFLEFYDNYLKEKRGYKEEPEVKNEDVDNNSSNSETENNSNENDSNTETENNAKEDINNNSVEFIDTENNEKIVFEQNKETNKLEPTTKIDLDTQDVVSLKEGQTISHIAQKTDFNSIDLLEYNNLTLEQAKNLPVGFKVKIPKDIQRMQSTEGEIKFFENHEGGGLAIVPSSEGKVFLEYEKGDFFESSPNRVSFGNETWTKGSDGVLFKSQVNTEDFKIDYIQNEDGNSVVSNIEIKKQTSFEELAKHTNYSKEELKEFNHLESDSLEKDSKLQIPVKVEYLEGGYGDITQYTTQDGEYIFIVPNSDNTKTIFATFTDGFNENGVYRKEVA